MGETATLEEPLTGQQTLNDVAQAIADESQAPVTPAQVEDAKSAVARTRDGRFAPKDVVARDKMEREAYEKHTGEKVTTPPIATPEPEAPSSESAQDAAATPTQTSEAPAPSAAKADAPPIGSTWDGTKWVAPAQTDKADLARATWLLKRAQWDDEDIKSLSPEKIIAKAGKLEPFLTRADQALKNTGASNAPNQNGRSTAASNAAAVDQNATEASEAPTDDLDALLNDLADPQREKQIRETVQRAEERARTAEQSAGMTRIDTAFQSLFNEIPGLQDPKVITEAIKRMDQWDPTGTALRSGNPAELRELVKAVSWSLLGEQIKQQSQQAARTRNKAQLNGQPTRVTESRSPSTKPSMDEIEKSSYDKVMKKYGLTG